jgi:hypothetical protein
MSSGVALVSWRWCSACGALVRDWKWTDFCSRPAMRSISSWIAAVVMRHSSLLLMVLFDHGEWVDGDATWDALLVRFVISRMLLLYCYLRLICSFFFLGRDPVNSTAASISF